MISALIYGSISGALYYYKPDIGIEVYKKLTTTIIENACELAKKNSGFHFAGRLNRPFLGEN